MRHHRPARLGAALLLATLLAWATPAKAARGEGVLYGSAGVSNLYTVREGGAHPGLAAQAGGLWYLSDFWRAWLDVTGSLHFAAESGRIPPLVVTGVSAGAVFAWDVITWVPWAGAGLMGYLAAPPQEPAGGPLGLGLRLSLGVDRRYSREWSVGLVADTHYSFDEPSQWPAYSSASLRLVRHFRGL